MLVSNMKTYESILLKVQVDVYPNSKYSNIGMVSYKLLLIVVERIKHKMIRNNYSYSFVNGYTNIKNL